MLYSCFLLAQDKFAIFLHRSNRSLAKFWSCKSESVEWRLIFKIGTVVHKQRMLAIHALYFKSAHIIQGPRLIITEPSNWIDFSGHT